MKKRICLLLCVFCMGLGLKAQQFVESFREDYLKAFYEDSPDSLRQAILSWQTEILQEQVKNAKNLDDLEKYIKKETGFSDLSLRFRSDEFCAYVRCTENGFRYDFYYINERALLCKFCLLENYGTCNKVLKTKSGRKYFIDFAWGFLKLKEDKFPLLDCYCYTSKIADGELDMTIIPFKGTNPFRWEEPSGDVFVPAF